MGCQWFNISADIRYRKSHKYTRHNLNPHHCSGAYHCIHYASSPTWLGDAGYNFANFVGVIPSFRIEDAGGLQLAAGTGTTKVGHPWGYY